jgi:nucleoside-diphosphate-sugar epimerase
MEARTRIAIAGATGRVGRRVVDVLEERRHEVVAFSRSRGVDVVTGERLAEALTGVEIVIDASGASVASLEQDTATEFFTAAGPATCNGSANARACSGSSSCPSSAATGSQPATARPSGARERAVLAGPIPARMLRAAQFHEFVDRELY